MSPPAVSIRYVVIDVGDLDRGSRFWSALLGTPEVRRAGQYAWLDQPAPEAPSVVLQRVPEPKRGKARCHVDLQTADRSAARDHAVSLGATVLAEFTELGYELSVLADPDGNEFCIIQPVGSLDQPGT